MKKQKRCLFCQLFSSKKLFSEVIPFILLFLSFASCDITDNDDNPPLPPLPEDAAIYLSMDGTEAGLWILNANTFELIDNMITVPGVPWYIEFSLDKRTVFSSWHSTPSYLYSLYSFTLPTFNILQTTSILNGMAAIVSNVDKNFIIAYGAKGIQIFESSTFSLIGQDTSSFWGEFSRITPSRNTDIIYFTWIENRQIVGFGKYDLTSLKVIDTLRLFNDAEFNGLQDVDLIVSNDDKYLFFSAFNWRGLNGFGSFFVIDLNQRTIVKEFRAGAFSQLAISPDGKSVYISDPGGYLYNFLSSGKVWRYDVENHTMNVLLNDLYYSDRITVAEDNRTLFITPFVSFTMRDGQKAWVVKIDAQNGQIKDYYPVIYDSTGYYTNNPRNIRMGQYIK